MYVQMRKSRSVQSTLLHFFFVNRILRILQQLYIYAYLMYQYCSYRSWHINNQSTYFIAWRHSINGKKSYLKLQAATLNFLLMSWNLYRCLRCTFKLQFVVCLRIFTFVILSLYVIICKCLISVYETIERKQKHVILQNVQTQIFFSMHAMALLHITQLQAIP